MTDTRVGPDVPFTPGTVVTIVGKDAQAAVGGEHGVVVGDTAGHVTANAVKVVVALDAPAYTNAIISTTDLEADSKSQGKQQEGGV